MKSQSSKAAAPASQQTVESIVGELKRLGTPKARTGMSRFGIQTSHAFGISIPQLRTIAKKIRTNHGLR